MATDVTGTLNEVIVSNSTGTRVAGMLLEIVVEELPPAGKVAATGVVADAHNVAGRLASTGALVDAHTEGGRLAATAMIVDAVCDFCFEGVLITTGVIVDGFERVEYDVRALDAKANDLFQRIRNEEQRIRDLLDAGTVPDNDLRGFISNAAGFRQEIIECREELDSRNVLDALIYFDGAEAIRLWTWERSLRSAFVTADRQLRVSQEIANELLDNRPGRVYATRAGDTLQSIAVRYFGSAESWRRIAEANPDLEVGELTPGTVINIPEGE